VTNGTPPQPAERDEDVVAIDVFPTVVARDHSSTEPVESVELLRRDVGSVHADHVTMEHAGVEHIDAKRVNVTNSGIRSVQAQSAQITNTGVLTLTSGSTSAHQSSVVHLATDTAQVSMSAVVFLNGRNVSVDPSTKIVLGAGEGVRAILTPASALAFGLGIGAVLLGAGRLFRRRS